MAENKKSFILYTDLFHTVKKMPDDKAGTLFKTILAYVNDENPLVDDMLVDLVFEPIKLQMKRDLQRWEKEIEKKSESGTLGNLKRWNNDLYLDVLSQKITLERATEIAKHRRASHSDVSGSHPIASVAVTDTVNVNDTVTVIKEKEKEKIKRFAPPSILEVQEYITEKKYSVSAASFWNFYESKNWYVGKNKMKNWKTAIGGWEARNKEQNGKSNYSASGPASGKISGRGSLSADSDYHEFT